MDCTPQRPRPLAELPPERLAAAVGVMTDIDDTLTRDGVVEPSALAALGTLAAAGVPVVAVTGRPLGWSRERVTGWPVAAVVAENGGVALLRQGSGFVVEYAQDASTRERNVHRLRDVATRVLRHVPGARLAQDSAGRVTDIAVDHAEHTQLSAARIGQVVALMRDAGMNATVSSIHVNGWFGDHDKWTGARWMVRRLYGRDLANEVGRWLYVGDSPNDQPMFERFPLAVGVANLCRHGGELRVWPAYIAQGERGDGFAEVAQALLAAKGRGDGNVGAMPAPPSLD